MKNDWTREIERLRAEIAALKAANEMFMNDKADLRAEIAALKAEIDRLKKPKGFHDVSDLYDDGITGRQWMIEQEASHE